MNKAEFEAFNKERIAINRKVAGLKKSVTTKALKYLKEVKGIDTKQEQISLSFSVNEKSIYGQGPIELEGRGYTLKVEKTYKVPRSYIFPNA